MAFIYLPENEVMGFAHSNPYSSILSRLIPWPRYLASSLDSHFPILAWALLSARVQSPNFAVTEDAFTNAVTQ